MRDRRQLPLPSSQPRLAGLGVLLPAPLLYISQPLDLDLEYYLFHRLAPVYLLRKGISRFPIYDAALMDSM